MSGDIEMSAVQIWEQFCEQLKQAGQVLSRDGLPKDDINLAEGLRHLVRQIRMGFEITCEYADPDFPQIVPANTATMMAEGPTSDCRYHHAFIDGTNTYLLRGKLGTAPLFEFSVYAGKIGLQDESRQISSITETDLIVEPGGHFEIVLSPDEHSGNWLRTDDTTSYLFLRQYTLDWSTTESATYTICKRGIETGKQPLNLEMMSNALEKTAAFVERGPRFWGALVDQRAAEEPNTFHTISRAQSDNSPTMPIGHQFSFGYFKLSADEALLVEFRPKEVPFWSIQLTNCWFEALTFDDNRSRINNQSARCDPNGLVRVIIIDGAGSKQNAVDTLGHREGTMVFRWSRTAEPVPAIKTEVIKRTSSLDARADPAPVGRLAAKLSE